ncbi:MAG: hypothetical protein A2X02_07095 [Bacteroidetes bacterium GWF2_29_10]|nr:MAG: hypothetical protein A2X02_07095 [Bacteroidetes bacterium GWF2_29_10]
MSKEVEVMLPYKQSDNLHLLDIMPNILPITNIPQKRSFIEQILNKATKSKKDINENFNISINSIQKRNFDLFHPTYYDDYFLEYIQKKPYVVTVHDMIYELYPELFNISDKIYKTKHNIVKNATAVIAVSQNTKKDIIELYGISDKKIHVVYHGNSIETNRENNDIQKNNYGSYFLYVGNRYSYKNFYFLVSSIANTLKEKNIKLICSNNKFTPKEIEYFKFLNIEHLVLNIEANDSTLAKLYKNAIALLFPSLIEGFGMPLIEAFSMGCPVICSDIPVFHEVANNAAIYFNPKSAKSINEVVNIILTDKQLRSDLIQKSYQREKLFSWNKTSKKTVDVYKSML